MSLPPLPPVRFRDLHREILQNAIPQWLGEASAHKQAALKAAPVVIADWYASASGEQHRQLKPLIAQAWTTQNLVDKALQDLQSPEDFASERLQLALKSRFGIEQDVATIYLRLYVAAPLSAFSIAANASRVRTLSLRDAALHNFEQAETLADAYDPNSRFISRPDANGLFESLSAINARLSVPTFARLCRELDIGAQYQRYLKQYLGLDNPVADARLRGKVRDSQVAALKVALQMALMKNDIPASTYSSLHFLLDGTPPLEAGCEPLLCHDLYLMSARMTGIVLFAPDLEHSQGVAPVIAYIPEDPQHPLKHYPSSADFMQDLLARLRTPQYQKFFSRFVEHSIRPHFFADLNNRLSAITWHPHSPGDPLPTWREEPIERPNLQLRAVKFDDELFKHLYEAQFNALINDAQSIAVATARADQQARWRRWDAVAKIASGLLEVAAFIATPFVPPMGLLMLGYSAYQLLDETIEGIVDWAEGQRSKAFEHLMSIAEQLVQLGLFATGLPLAEDVLRKTLSPQLWAFFDRLKPVTSTDGKTRLWQPDLSPYAHDLQLAKHSRPDTQGLHTLRGQQVLPLAGKHYVVAPDPASARPHLLHPLRPEAYRPLARGNGEGAWLGTEENPLAWNDSTLMRRLGYHADGLSDSQLAQVRHISATDADALRKLHLNQEPMPPLLKDSHKRFVIDQALGEFIAQLNSDDPAVYALADKQTQVMLLSHYGLLPRSKTLRFLDGQGKTAWELAGDPDASVVQIHEAQLDNGEFLSTVLQSLSEPERKVLLEEEFGYPATSLQARTQKLRKRLASLAQGKRTSLFDSRYRTQEYTQDPRLTALIDTTPGLPLSAAEELLSNASAADLKQIDAGRVPTHLVELARWARLEVRISRAYEGLYLASVDNPDTDRLALHSLQQLPGWPTDVCIQVKQYSAGGRNREIIGNPYGAVQRLLIATEDGHYIPADAKGPLFGQTDLYTAILQALPDAARDALKIHIAQGPQLKQGIIRHAIDRTRLRALLAAEPVRKPTYDPRLMRLPGGMEGYRAAPTPGPSQGPSLEQQVHQLFPAWSPEQIRDLSVNLRRVPGGAQSALASLQHEYLTLDQDIAVWENNVRRPSLGPNLQLRQQQHAYERQTRRLWGQELRRAWRHETALDDYYEPPTRNGRTLHLGTSLESELPLLSVRFEYISHLTLEGNNLPLGNLNAFLQGFPRLRFLAIRSIPLGELPPAVFDMTTLNELVLSECNITLTADSQRRLTAMPRLKTLDLFSNPLHLTPSVENMPDLEYIDLEGTSIAQFPPGLSNRPHLHTAILSNNRIEELPAALFDLPARTSERFDLGNNPLSRATLEQVKAYCHRTGQYWEADAPAADRAQVQALYPTFGHQDINRFIYSLPGNLEMGTIELARLEVEYAQLENDLSPWISDPNASEATRTARLAFKNELQACWRRETALDPDSLGSPPTHELALDLSATGPLPELHAALGHVSTLTLKGDGAAVQIANLLGNFTALERLNTENLLLGSIPPSVFQLSRLRGLSLNKGAIELTAQSVQALAGLPHLQRLHLDDNPIGLLPDVARMPHLIELSLQNTGLNEISTTLQDALPRLTLKMNRNAITQVPDELFAMPAAATQGLDLSANPLSAATLEKIKSYCQANRVHLGADAPPQDQARARMLYPTLADDDINGVLFQLPGTLDDISLHLTRLETEAQTLDADLSQWALDVPLQHPLHGTPLDEQSRAAEQVRRLSFKAQLQRCWHREPPQDAMNPQRLLIDTHVMGDLPQVGARFEAITELELVGDKSGMDVSAFLKSFPHLNSLSISGYALRDVPQVVLNTPRLIVLGLDDCDVHLSASSADALSGMSNLEFLDLEENPLGRTPDLSHMHKLTTLYLGHTGLTEVPPGLFSLSQLRALNLRNNLIREIPSDILELPTPLDDDSDLSGNPLSEQSLEYLRQYYVLTGNSLNVEEATVAADGTPLTPQPMRPSEA